MVSVIMTVYNEPIEWVKEAINSLKKQTFKKFKLILVVDNPNYESLSELRKFCDFAPLDIILHINDNNKGLVRSLNIALEYVDTPFVARMDSDDIALNFRFEEEMNFLKDNDLDFVASEVIEVNESGQKIETWHRLNKNLLSNDVKKMEQKQNIFWHPTWLLKKEVVEELGGYRNIKFAEDYDFVVRAIIKGFKLGMQKKPTVKKRIRQGAISEDNGLLQIVTANNIAKSFRKKTFLKENELSLDISKQDIVEFNNFKEAFKKRKSGGLISRIALILKLLTSRIGRIFLRATLMQKLRG
ncbi:glycosyltransferase [Pediococcus acidilactici]|uniref:glycosyltransferase n=1 Tax=Pediococcus acidilactici TaxID=1254 RepID=UPI00132FB6D3|nr:glycosyltransferase [Pediococcus acidilactici]QQC45229.1 glycosyltransferase [Pediococcus acidilactici]